MTMVCTSCEISLRELMRKGAFFNELLRALCHYANWDNNCSSLLFRREKNRVTFQGYSKNSLNRGLVIFHEHEDLHRESRAFPEQLPNRHPNLFRISLDSCSLEQVDCCFVRLIANEKYLQEKSRSQRKIRLMFSLH